MSIEDEKIINEKIIDEKKFPFSEIRPKQQNIINKINNNPDKRYIIIEAETGVGKSAVAVTACKDGNKGYIVTSTKQLQNQYMSDFYNQSITSVKGRNNYRCYFEDRLTCNNGYCLINHKQSTECKKEHLCPYYNARNRGLKSDIFLTSYKYFLKATDNPNTFLPRGTVVFDECHLLESILVESFEITLSLKDLDNKYNILDSAELQDAVRLSNTSVLKDGYTKENEEWINKIYNLLNYKKNIKFEEIKEQLGIVGDPETLTEEEMDLIIEENDDYVQIDRLCRQIKGFLVSKNINEDWIIEPLEDGLLLTPLNVQYIFKNEIEKMAKNRIIFMSATILDIKGFIKTFGLDEDDCLVIRCESDFDPDKSPIYTLQNCSTNYNALKDEKNLQKIKDEVEKILEKHKNEKGIIHTGNSTISKYLKDNIKGDRLLVRYDNIQNNDIINFHNSTKKPTVLVSSSLNEGVDLKNDLSRFQIIVKLPFLSLADSRTKVKKDIDNNWYLAETFKKFVQQCGRSTRNSEDYSVTYVLDNKFAYWFGKAKKNKWFSKNFITRIRKE